jgi:hypothetical protein
MIGSCEISLTLQSMQLEPSFAAILIFDINHSLFCNTCNTLSNHFVRSTSTGTRTLVEQAMGKCNMSIGAHQYLLSPA